MSLNAYVDKYLEVVTTSDALLLSNVMHDCGLELPVPSYNFVKLKANLNTFLTWETGLSRFTCLLTNATLCTDQITSANRLVRLSYVLTSIGQSSTKRKRKRGKSLH